MKDSLINIKNKIGFYYKKFDLNFKKFFNKNLLLIITIIITILSLTARYLVALYPTNDVAGIIFGWIREIREIGLNNFYKVKADYSYFLLFIYGIIAQFPIGKEITVGSYTFAPIWMYSIKTLNFINDILLAVAIALIIYHITKNKTKAYIGFWIIICLPVQFADSALWGNCDSLYVMLFAFTLLAILKKKDWLVWLIFGFTLGTKLQAVFILPFLVFLCLSRRLKFYDIIFGVIGLFITFMPAWCCGSGFTLPFTYFSTQVGRFPNLTLGCANMWHLFNVNSQFTELISKGATVIGLLLIGLFMGIIYLRKIKLTDENIIRISIFLISIVPFFLPHMHERYFFFLDVGVVIYMLLTNRKRDIALIVLMQISSGIAYYHYLTGHYFIEALGEDSVNIATFINIFVLTYLFIDLLKLDRDKSSLEEADEINKELIQLNKEYKDNSNK